MATPGTVIGTIQNTTQGSTVSIFSQSIDGAFQVALVGDAWQLQVGPMVPAGSNSLTVTLVETLANGLNSPNITGPLTVLETAGGTMVGGQFGFNDPTQSGLIWIMYGA